tara:strand:+ start:585 stop:1418 length:834 start_codon:yes stop_codon:yes gene_type:complete
MSIVVKEKIGTRTLQRSALSSPTGKRVFDVFDDPPTSDKPLTAMVALRAEGVPKLGDSHPEDRTMTLNSFDVKANTSSNHLQTITCNYAVTGLDGGGTYTALSTGVRGVFMDTWRNNPYPPPVEFPNSVGILTVDIEGDYVDVAGKAVSVAIMQQTLEMRSPFANEPDFGIIRQITNTRNLGEWNGFPEGVLLYLGASASVTNGNIWTTTHKFAADPIYHARQVSAKLSDGKPDLIEIDPPDNAPEGSVATLHAKRVYWVQKFPYLRDFGALGIGNP